MKVLLVEDNPTEVKLAKRELLREGNDIHVDSVGTCREALRKLEDNDTYDIALVDLRLPDGDGISILREITKRRLPIPVVIITAFGDEETAVGALKAGADDYLVKTGKHFKQLPSVIKKVVERRSGQPTQDGISPRVLFAGRNDAGFAAILHHIRQKSPHIHIEIADSAEELMTRLSAAEISFDVLLLDYDKAGVNVLEIIRYLKIEKGLDTPIVVIANPGNQETVSFVMSSGATDYVVKSDSIQLRLPSVIENAYRKVRLEREHAALKEREKEVRRSEARYRELADFLPQPVFETDAAGNILFANRALTEMFGIPEEKNDPRFNLFDFISREERERARACLEKIFLEGKAGDERFTISPKHGVNIPVLISASPIVRESEIIGVRGILIDLSEIASAHEAILASENRYRFLFESSADEFFMIDDGGRFQQVNEAGCEKLGYTRDEMIGQRLTMILVPENVGATDNRVEQAFREKDITFESVHVRKDGTRIPVEVHSRAVIFEGKPVLLSVARDLSERKRAEAAIAQRNRQLKILSAASVKINSVLNATEILRTLVVSGIELVGATAGSFGLLEDGVLVFREYYENGSFRPIDVKFEPGKGTPGQVLLTRRPRITNDSKNNHLVVKEIHEKFGIYNTIDVPILSRSGNVLGMFAIHNSVGRRPFIEVDIEMLEGLAASAAVALENASLLSDVKKGESAIRESEEKFRTLVESSLVGVYIIQDDKFVYTNPAMSRLYGYTEEEFLMMGSLFETVFPDDRTFVKENIKKRIEGDTYAIKYEFRAVKKSGDIVRAEVFGARTTFAGRPALIGTAVDITERKLAEEMLQRSEERYRSLFEESLDAIYVTTPSGKIIDINSAGVNLFGFKLKREMLDLETVDVLYDNPADRDKLKDAINDKGFVRDSLLTLKKKDGSRIMVQDSSTVLRDADGKVVAYRGILRDVTEKKRLEEQLLQSQKLESLGQLTSGIAHDFNNVLGGIIGFTELALGKTEENNPVNGYLMRIYGLADRAAKITKQLLAFARRQILMPRNLDLNELVGDMIELLKRLLGEQVQIRFTPAGGLKTVLADSSQIEQVLLNLAVNAGDAMPEGGLLTIETANAHLDDFYCKIHTNVKPGAYVALSVTDTGDGIAPSIVDHIFEPFFTTKEVGKGTGLGLSVVHGIVRQHGGTVNVYSEVGKGTTFKVYFPAVEKVHEETRNERESVRELRGGSETVLVVEDNEDLREFMKTLLAENGYKVLVACEGEEGEAIFEEHSSEIDLIISDIIMPKMSGIDLRKSVIAKYPGSRFLFISGYTDSAVHHGYLTGDKVEFLQKPFTAFEFAERVREILDHEES